MKIEASKSAFSGPTAGFPGATTRKVQPLEYSLPRAAQPVRQPRPVHDSTPPPEINAATANAELQSKVAHIGRKHAQFERESLALRFELGEGQGQKRKACQHKAFWWEQNDWEYSLLWTSLMEDIYKPASINPETAALTYGRCSNIKLAVRSGRNG
ncbi:hypothetical protein VTO42DRAFT_5934 [Malbranchea cinnamomea]